MTKNQEQGKECSSHVRSGKRSWWRQREGHDPVNELFVVQTRPMFRRPISIALLAILALQLLGGIAAAAVCVETCADAAESASCAPACVDCTTCAHTQQAIVQNGVPVAPHQIAPHAFQALARGTSSPLADDIFHVPLAA